MHHGIPVHVPLGLVYELHMNAPQCPWLQTPRPEQHQIALHAFMTWLFWLKYFPVSEVDGLSWFTLIERLPAFVTLQGVTFRLFTLLRFSEGTGLLLRVSKSKFVSFVAIKPQNVPRVPGLLAEGVLNSCLLSWQPLYLLITASYSQPSAVFWSHLWNLTPGDYCVHPLPLWLRECITAHLLWATQQLLLHTPLF